MNFSALAIDRFGIPVRWVRSLGRARSQRAARTRGRCRPVCPRLRGSRLRKAAGALFRSSPPLIDCPAGFAGARSSCAMFFCRIPSQTAPAAPRAAHCLPRSSDRFPQRRRLDRRVAVDASSSPAITRRCLARLQRLDVTLADTQRAFLFMTVRGVSVRRGAAGPDRRVRGPGRFRLTLAPRHRRR